MKERGRTEALTEKRRAEGVAIGQAERKALATVAAAREKASAARAKEKRGVTEQIRREGVKRTATAIPRPQTKQQIALEKAKLDKLTSDIADVGGSGALSPSQSLALNKQLLKSKSAIAESPDHPASQADMDFVNQHGDEAVYHKQRIETENPLFPGPSEFPVGESIPLPVRIIGGNPTQLTMKHIREIAATESMTIDQVLQALAIVGE